MSTQVFHEEQDIHDEDGMMEAELGGDNDGGDGGEVLSVELLVEDDCGVVVHKPVFVHVDFLDCYLLFEILHLGDFPALVEFFRLEDFDY